MIDSKETKTKQKIPIGRHLQKSTHFLFWLAIFHFFKSKTFDEP